MEKVSSHNSWSFGASDDRSVSLKQIVIGGRCVTVLPNEEGGDTHAISSFIQRTAFDRSSLNDQRAFNVIDLGDVVRKYRTWVDELPDIVPYYAVKCNDDSVILSVLARLGAGFDCASKNEIQQILDMRDISVSTDRIIYANAVKEDSFIRYAAEKGVRLLTFDCEEELLKIKNEHPSADLVVRIREHLTSGAQLVGMELSLSHKFGCLPSEAVRLVGVAEQLKLRVVGVSFHAGCRVYDTSIYERAVAAAKFVFDATLARCGRRLEVLDIGGGFYGDRNARLPFEKAAAAIQSAISKYFGDELSTGLLRIIAEPGQYMTASASTLVVNVIGVRRVTNHGAANSSCHLACDPAATETSYHYFLNDGAHGSFRYYMETNDLRLVRKVPRRILGRQQASHSTPLLHESSTKNEVVFKSVLWGPTCDSGDVIDNDCRIERLDLGDWLVFEDMGFYSTACSSSFNGMPAPDVKQLKPNHKTTVTNSVKKKKPTTSLQPTATSVV